MEGGKNSQCAKPYAMLCFSFFFMCSHNIMRMVLFYYPHFAEEETGGPVKDLPEVIQQVAELKFKTRLLLSTA